MGIDCIEPKRLVVHQYASRSPRIRGRIYARFCEVSQGRQKSSDNPKWLKLGRSLSAGWAIARICESIDSFRCDDSASFQRKPRNRLAIQRDAQARAAGDF